MGLSDSKPTATPVATNLRFSELEEHTNEPYREFLDPISFMQHIFYLLLHTNPLRLPALL